MPTTFTQGPTVGDKFVHDFSFSDEQISEYAKISGDINPIHVSADYGKKSMFGKCIVHGYFSISIFSKIYGTLLYPEQHILISQTAKYLKPIFTNSNYTAVFIALEIIPHKHRVRYLNEIIDKESGELKVTGEAILMNKKYYNW